MAGEQTAAEAAVLARRIVATMHDGELATTMSSRRRPSLGGFPFSSFQYFSDDCAGSGNPLVMLVTWGTHGSNAQANHNASLFVRDKAWFHQPDPASRGPLDHARLTLFGTLDLVPSDRSQQETLCFFAHNPDAAEALSGHDFKVFQLRIAGDVSWVGGFGDEHYVGWIPMDLYLAAGRAPAGPSLVVQP
ncbi:pyridoxamine 5'-phosphate oxidase-domain-containing protein [Entophlyctis helioformis]|nr:pyridoxamine 5'-phosphate oxidase-domain-containing protein [Entophlyctis helioformis]